MKDARTRPGGPAGGGRSGQDGGGHLLSRNRLASAAVHLGVTRGVAAALVCLAATPGATADATDLRDQLRALSESGQFDVRGLDRVSGAAVPAAPAEDRPIAALRVILEGYDYVLVNDSSGELAEVRILGRSQPPAPASAKARPERIAIQSTRRGSHHELAAVLVGPNANPLRVDLLVDTGASTVVLPLSMREALGFRPDELTPGWAETAGGRVKLWTGELQSLAVGAATERRVAVSFIDDARLGGRGLLGMSFLGRFTLVVDDAANEIVLLSR